MVSITQCCARLRDSRPGNSGFPTKLLTVLVTLLALAACSPQSGDFGFSILGAELRHRGNAVEVVVHQKFDLSDEAQSALTHGVPLFIRTELELRPRDSRRDFAHLEREFEIRYLPLSELYQVTISQPHEVKTFPRLRHVLAEMRTVGFTLGTTVLPTPDLELRARSSLNTRRMPPPMRLPAWFSAEWRHDTGWTSWPVESGPAAG